MDHPDRPQAHDDDCEPILPALIPRDHIDSPPRHSPLRRTPVAHVVREPAATLNRITTIHPRTYNEAKTIGEAFRDGVPVIMNLTDMVDADPKRLLGFAAGPFFGLPASLAGVTSKAFLPSPAHAEVAAEEPAPPVSTRGFFNQS